MTPFLTNLGVSMPAQASFPTVASFPARFNPAGTVVWSLVVQGKSNFGDPAAMWELCIKEYVDACAKQGIHPFAEQATDNKELLAVLSKARTEVLAILTAVEHPLLDQYAVLEIDRRCELYPDGFDLGVEALFKNDDPTFNQHLLQQGFGPVNMKYVRRASQNSVITFERLQTQANRWVVGYIISGKQLPVLPDLLATKDQLQKFMLRVWRTQVCYDEAHTGPKFI